MNRIATSNTIFEIDTELDALLEEIQEQVELLGEPPEELRDRFQQFCEAHAEKVDRLGRFLRMMQAREQFCRDEAGRLLDRARVSANKMDRTKSMVLFYLLSQGLKKVEGREFTLRAQRNSQDSVRIINEAAVPIAYSRLDLKLNGVLWETVLSHLPEELAKLMCSSIQQKRPDSDAIKDAGRRGEQVSGAEVRRGFHLRTG